MDKKKFKNYDLLNGDYSVFTSAECATIVKNSLLNQKQKSLYFPPFSNEFQNEKEYSKFIEYLINYGGDKVDLNHLEVVIKSIKEKIKEDKKRELLTELQHLAKEEGKEIKDLFEDVKPKMVRTKPRKK